MNLLELWPALHKAALLGTERHAQALRLPEGAPQSLRDSLAADPEGALLSLLAGATLARRAGAVPIAPASIEPGAPCREESRAVAPVAACLRLRGFSGGDVVMLHLWLGLAHEHEVLAPPDALPMLLRLGTRDKSLRASVLAVVGERGAWLAEQNREWKWARGQLVEAHDSFEDAASLFQGGVGATRVSAIVRMRQEDAARALQVLASAWPREDVESRSQILQLLRVDLWPEDEGFLESALDDRALSVRQAAAQVLVALPESKLVARMIERACKYLHASREQDALRIEAALPRAWSGEWARDGLEQNLARAAASPQAPGQRTWWLAQMLALVPPSTWEHRWSATPDEIIEAVARDEAALLEGFRLASIRARDARWISAWLRAALWNPTIGNTHAAYLLKALESGERDSLLCDLVRTAASVGDEDAGAFVVGLLTALTLSEAWSHELSRAVLDWMRDVAERVTQTFSQHSSHAIIRHAPALAARMHSDVLARADENWPDEMPAAFTSARQALLDVMAGRNEMQREFD